MKCTDDKNAILESKWDQNNVRTDESAMWYFHHILPVIHDIGKTVIKVK